MLYKYLPYFIFKPLFGDRERFGLKTDHSDEEFLRWQNDYYLLFYNDNQKGGIGKAVNHLGFKIIDGIVLTEKIVLELGPGSIDHLDYNKTIADEYIIADINQDFLYISEQRLTEYGQKNVTKIEIMDDSLPLSDNSVDVVITFNQLEHIYKLEEYILEIKRVLKTDGILVGSVPTEGSFAWGLGRFLTSRRYVRKNLDINYDKIICWEHPNFVNKIKMLLDANFTVIKNKKKPFGLLPFDLNLSWSFIYMNK